MKSKTLSSSRVLLKYFYSTVVWLTFGYTLLTFISLPLALYVISMNDKRVDEKSFIDINNPLLQVGTVQLIVALIFAALIAVVIFNYKNKEASSDYIHSLPVRREIIYSNAIIAGVIAIVIPIIITTIIVMLEKPLLTFDISIKNILMWALFTLFVQLVMFFISVFAGMIVNSITLHIEMVLILLFLPLILWAVIVLTADVFYDGLPILVGFGLSNIITPIHHSSFPIYAVTEFFGDDFDVRKLIIWAIIGLLALIVSGILYKNRDNEKVTHGFNYGAVYHVLVLVLTIVGMLALSMVITLILPDIKLLTIFVFIFAAIVAYLFVLMFMQDTLRIQFKLKEVLTTAVGISIFFLVFTLGWNHFTQNVPKEEQIQGVLIDDNTASSPSYDTTHLEYFNDNYLFESDQKKITSVLNLHEYLIKESFRQYFMHSRTPITISYLLDNGQKKSRVYSKLPEDNDELSNKIAQVDITPFSITRDFLYNIKEDKIKSVNEISTFEDEDSSIKLNSKAFRILAKDYKNHIQELEDGNKVVIENSGFIPISLDTNNTVLSGQSSIYNSTLREYLKKNEVSLKENLISDTELTGLYEIDLNKVNNKKALFNNLVDVPVYELEKKYEFKELEGADLEKGIQKLENYEFDSKGNKLYIITDKPYDKDEPLYYSKFTVVVKD